MARNAAPLVMALGGLGLLLLASAGKRKAAKPTVLAPRQSPAPQGAPAAPAPGPTPQGTPGKGGEAPTIEAGAVLPPELAMTDAQIRDNVSQDAKGNTVVSYAFLTETDPVKYAPNGTHLQVLKAIYQRTYPKGSVGAAFQEAIDEAPGNIYGQMRDYHLTENGSFLPLLLLPFDASASFHDQYSIMAAPRDSAPDQYGRGKPPGSPPAGLTWEGFTELATGTYGMLKDAIASSRGFVKGITNNPLWKIAQTGIAFVPGIGTAVSVGMSAAYAYGNDISLKDAALKALRDAVPGGAVGEAAFDIGVGLAQGEDLSDAAITAARNQLPEGDARTAFDAGIKGAKGQNIAPDIKTTAEAKGKAQAEKALGGLFK